MFKKGHNTFLGHDCSAFLNDGPGHYISNTRSEWKNAIFTVKDPHFDS